MSKNRKLKKEDIKEFIQLDEIDNEYDEDIEIDESQIIFYGNQNLAYCLEVLIFARMLCFQGTHDTIYIHNDI